MELLFWLIFSNKSYWVLHDCGHIIVQIFWYVTLTRLGFFGFPSDGAASRPHQYFLLVILKTLDFIVWAFTG